MANIKLNFTAFTSASMALKITNAMQHCLSTGEVVRVANRRGVEFLLVTIIKDSLGYTFRFLSMYDDADVGDLILKAHHSWPESFSVSFWGLLAHTFELTEHPFITLSKEHAEKSKGNGKVFAEVAYRDSLHDRKMNDAIHKAHGATHRATDSLGKVVFMSFKRTWWGLGKTKAYVHQVEIGCMGLWVDSKTEVNADSFTLQGVL